MDKPIDASGIRNITISGRIGTGKTTLANNLAKTLHWKVLDGGKLFRKFAKEQGFHISEKHKIPDELDKAFEERVKYILKNEKNEIIQSHLAGFTAQGIPEVFKILVICEDKEGEDKKSIRIDRIMNRDNVPSEKAREEIHLREEMDLAKYRKLYVNNDQNWVYWDPKYYDLIINTFDHNAEESLKVVLKALGLPQ
ncbi:MAG: Cytidylate kinase [Candidatus Levybacteria bacterium GW2011_GWA2_36_13]|nr:MAG: Cytidylate kinase [Candidatus Levybacteria bacterium GW2011_GWA2_36_13]